MYHPLHSLKRHRRLAALLPVALLLAALARGQDPEPGPAETDTAPEAAAAPETAARSLTLQNLAPTQRREWVRVAVPFAQGAVPAGELPDLHVAEHATVWQPFGAAWPDGSLRHAFCLFRPTLAPLSEKGFALRPGAGPAPPAPAFGLGPHELAFVVTQRGETTRTTLEIVELLESNAACQLVLMRGRLGKTGLVGEITLEVFSDQAHGYAGFAVFFSDPSTTAMQAHFDEIAVETRGLAWLPRHARPLGMQFAPTERGSRTVLLQNSVLGDGQGLRRTGALVPPLRGASPDDVTPEGATPEDAALHDDTLRAAATCRPLGATTWQDSEAYGAFGVVPPPPPWLAKGRVRPWLARQHAEFVRASATAAGDPFRKGDHQQAKSPGQTGDQADFGVVQLHPVAGTGIPSLLHEVELSVLQEACRPVHFFEGDGSPVHAAAHPDWVVWAGRTHWNSKTSPDRLGKGAREIRFETHGWKGKIRSHWSSNTLCAYYLLTGCPQALLEIRNEIRLYLAAQTVDPRHSTSGPGASRAVGRTLLTASWLHLCTGNAAVLQRALERIEKVALPCWFGRQFGEDRIRPYAIGQRDGRAFDGNTPYWAAWMDNLLVVGPAAIYELTGDAEAKELADGIALNMLRHAWRICPDGAARVVYTHRWLEGGQPLTEAQRFDPAFVKLSGSVAVWGVPALAWGRRAAAERGLTDLVERADDLLGRLRAGRRPPKDQGYDRFSAWDAVR